MNERRKTIVVEHEKAQIHYFDPINFSGHSAAGSLICGTFKKGIEFDPNIFFIIILKIFYHQNLNFVNSRMGIFRFKFIKAFPFLKCRNLTIQ